VIKKLRYQVNLLPWVCSQVAPWATCQKKKVCPSRIQVLVSGGRLVASGFNLSGRGFLLVAIQVILSVAVLAECGNSQKRKKEQKGSAS